MTRNLVIPTLVPILSDSNAACLPFRMTISAKHNFKHQDSNKLKDEQNNYKQTT